MRNENVEIRLPIEVMLVTGERLVTTRKYGLRHFTGLLRRGALIECKTTEGHEADRRLWTVLGGHVIKFRPVRS
jgi:hypothetical protein